MNFPDTPGKIGFFDSGYGGLTVLQAVRERLPGYDYLYLGDNARAPYGMRSFELVYEFTRQAVCHLFQEGCHLVVLACNTASAKALRSIQQKDLPGWDPDRRVLGVIRPTVEAIGEMTSSRHIGILATPGTVASHSYSIELSKLFPGVHVTERPAPMWVPLVETGEAAGPGADYFVKKYIGEIMEKDPEIDTLILGCTHYPLLLPKIRQFAPEGVKVVTQGELVASSLADYLQRHPDMESRCTRGGRADYLTTENPARFDSLASGFVGESVHSAKVTLN